MEEITQRAFIPGSEWIYYKLYSGTKSSDKILVNHILPIIEDLLNVEIIDKWFFIRYADPDEHIRLRLHLNDIQNFGLVVLKLSEILGELSESGLLWKIQLDTYNREIERYGVKSIPVLEQLFYIDSSSVLQIIKSVKNDNEIGFIAISLIDSLLNAFDYSIEEKSEIIERWHIGLGQEFNLDKSLRVQIDNKYRKDKNSVSDAFDIKKFDKEIKIVLKNKDSQTKIIANKIKDLYNSNSIEIDKVSLANSICHMTLNRLFRSKPRLSEMVVYGLMSRYYKSEIAKEKKSLDLVKTSLANN